MFALFPAKRAAARVRGCRPVSGRTLAVLAALIGLSACGPVTPPLAGNDPADPAARIAAIGYRSTIAPYTPLRPVTPSPWRNDGDAPQPKTDR